MKKLTKYQLTKVSKNLDYYFNLASDKDIKNGLDWYKKAYEICKDIADKFNTDTFTAAGVISALSPRNKWDQNIKDSYKVFKAINEGKGPEQIKVSTFHKNKFKAFSIAKKDQFITESSLKTFSFCQNIAFLNDNYITIDVWHLRACFNETMGTPGNLAYEQIKRITLKKARQAGLKGFEYQAIVWNSIRNNYINQ